MASLLRVAFIGGTEMLRTARRIALEENPNFKVVLDTDGFGLLAVHALSYDFDVAVLDLRLPNSSALDYVRAMHAMAKVNSADIGRILISATYSEPDLRLQAIRAGAVDCIFVEDGIESFVANVSLCKEPESDFAIRSLLPELPSGAVSEEEYASANVAIDTLDPKEQSILESFCALKTDSQIAQIAQVPKLKVRQTIKKVQNLLLLNTRSQLLLKLHELDALTL